MTLCPHSIPLDDYCPKCEAIEGVKKCPNCGGWGFIPYNPNLNPSSFPCDASAKCSRCGGSGIERNDAEDAAFNHYLDREEEHERATGDEQMRRDDRIMGGGR
jgi:hypothetical protein